MARHRLFRFLGGVVAGTMAASNRTLPRLQAVIRLAIAAGTGLGQEWEKLSGRDALP